MRMHLGGGGRGGCECYWHGMSKGRKDHTTECTGLIRRSRKLQNWLSNSRGFSSRGKGASRHIRRMETEIFWGVTNLMKNERGIREKKGTVRSPA